MANYTQFKSGNAFQTIQSSCSHQGITNHTDVLNQTSGIKRNITKQNKKKVEAKVASQRSLFRPNLYESNIFSTIKNKNNVTIL